MLCRTERVYRNDSFPLSLFSSSSTTAMYSIFATSAISAQNQKPKTNPQITSIQDKSEFSVPESRKKRWKARETNGFRGEEENWTAMRVTTMREIGPGDGGCREPAIDRETWGAVEEGFREGKVGFGRSRRRWNSTFSRGRRRRSQREREREKQGVDVCLFVCFPVLSPAFLPRIAQSDPPRVLLTTHTTHFLSLQTLSLPFCLCLCVFRSECNYRFRL